eukprot:269871_1
MHIIEEHKRKRRCKWILITVFIVFWYGICSILIVAGVAKINIAEKYQNESTKEDCLITNVTASECSYECNNKKEKWCDDTSYSYIATAPDKCGTQQLYTMEWPDNMRCPGTYREKGIHKCYVLQCHEKQFTFAAPSDHNAQGIEYVVGGVIMMLMLPCVVACFCKDRIKECIKQRCGDYNQLK